jgi:hypothetical protein
MLKLNMGLQDKLEARRGEQRTHNLRKKKTPQLTVLTL